MSFLTDITDSVGLTNTGATDAANRAAKGAQLTPYNIFSPGGGFAGFGTQAVPGAPSANGPSFTTASDGRRYTQFTGGTVPAGWHVAKHNRLVEDSPGSGSQYWPTAGAPGQSGTGGTPSGPVAQAYGGFGQQPGTAAAGGGFMPAQTPGQDIMYGLGDAESLRAGLVGFGGQALNAAGQAGQLPQNVQQAALISQLQQNPALLQSLGLQNQAFGQAQEIGSGAFGQNILDLLRQQAAPFENRQRLDLQQNQFNMGQLGTRGGVNQTEAFARGLGQADLGRQTQALSLSDQLLQSAYGRFGQATGLGSDIANQGLQNSFSLAQLPGQLQNTQLGLALQAINGQGALQTQGLNQFQTALNAAIARSNAASGVASNLTALSGQGGPLAGLASGVAGAVGTAYASDARLKDNITPTAVPGIYTWTWNKFAKALGVDRNPTVGVIAQDVARDHPTRVFRDAFGFLAVDYAGLALDTI